GRELPSSWSPPSYVARSSTGEAPSVRRGQRHPPPRARAPRRRNGTTRWSSSLALERSEVTVTPGIWGHTASIGASALDFKQNPRKACAAVICGLGAAGAAVAAKALGAVGRMQKIASETTTRSLSEAPFQR